MAGYAGCKKILICSTCKGLAVFLLQIRGFRPSASLAYEIVVEGIEADALSISPPRDRCTQRLGSGLIRGRTRSGAERLRLAIRPRALRALAAHRWPFSPNSFASAVRWRFLKSTIVRKSGASLATIMTIMTIMTKSMCSAQALAMNEARTISAEQKRRHAYCWIRAPSLHIRRSGF